MLDGCEDDEFYSMVKTVALAAIIIALIISGYLFVFTKEEYSSLYVIPESYQNQTMDDSISFTYGVICSEKKPTDYDIQIFLNNKLIHTEQFQLQNNERYENTEELPLTRGLTYPAKVQIILTNGIDTEYVEDVHFWLEKTN